ncbi:MAG: hypothetical protein KAY24_03360 [Candidatus Eisenbacteria sp.]|nr:hypothetical protein [Candidatus Eisenbacteria bacterium]
MRLIPPFLFVVGLVIAWQWCPAAEPADSQGQQSEARWKAYDPETLEPGKIPTVRLPVSFTVAPGSYLYLNWQPVREVTLTQGPEGRLYVNEVQILGPQPKVQDDKPHFGEEEVRKCCSDVPFVKRLVQSGLTWNQAFKKWGDQSRRIRRVTLEAHREALASGEAPERAAEIAVAAGFEADTAGIYERPDGIQLRDKVLQVFPVGLSEYSVFLSRRDSTTAPTADERAERAEKKALAAATELYRHLSGLGPPAFIRLTRWGMASSTGTRGVAEALKQLEEARQDPSIYPDGNLSPREIKKILEADGITPGW